MLSSHVRDSDSSPFIAERITISAATPIPMPSAVSALREGATDYLIKPFEAEVLMGRMDGWLPPATEFSDDEVIADMRQTLLPNEEWPLRITKTYRFGPRVLGRLDADAGETARKLRDEQDPYRRYSYALAFRRAYEDGNVNISARRFSRPSK